MVVESQSHRELLHYVSRIQTDAGEEDYRSAATAGCLGDIHETLLLYGLGGWNVRYPSIFTPPFETAWSLTRTGTGKKESLASVYEPGRGSMPSARRDCLCCHVPFGNLRSDDALFPGKRLVRGDHLSVRVEHSLHPGGAVPAVKGTWLSCGYASALPALLMRRCFNRSSCPSFSDNTGEPFRRRGP